MIHAKLNYSVFDRNYSVNLGNRLEKESQIEENHFVFDFQEKKSQKQKLFFLLF
jgi:hypothetical protein